MRIENEVKLDFKGKLWIPFLLCSSWFCARVCSFSAGPSSSLARADVLIRPKRSTLKSRSEVSLDRSYTMKHSKKTITAVPIIAANMDTTGTFEMAAALAKSKLLTAVHKHYTVEDWAKFQKDNADVLPYVAVSAGTSDDDFKKVTESEVAALAAKKTCDFSTHACSRVGKRCFRLFI